MPSVERVVDIQPHKQTEYYLYKTTRSKGGSIMVVAHDNWYFAAFYNKHGAIEKMRFKGASENLDVRTDND